MTSSSTGIQIREWLSDAVKAINNPTCQVQNAPFFINRQTRQRVLGRSVHCLSYHDWRHLVQLFQSSLMLRPSIEGYLIA
jgi:hypothetical protein